MKPSLFIASLILGSLSSFLFAQSTTASFEQTPAASILVENKAESPTETAEEAMKWETMDAIDQSTAPIPIADSPLMQFGAHEKPAIFKPSRVQQRPVPIYQARPLYPSALRKEGISGEVVIEFIVDSKGVVASAFAVRSTDRRFEEAALQAVARWTFKPATIDGRTVATRMQVPILFSLQAEPGPSGYFEAEPGATSKIAEARKRYPVTKPEIKARPRFQAKPIYPVMLRKAGIEVSVLIEFIVDTHGDVQTAFALRSTHREFEAPAVEAVSRWKFTPASAQGSPINCLIQVPVVFQLNADPAYYFADDQTVQTIANARKAYPLIPADKKPIIRSEKPAKYPESLKKQGIEGTVVVDFIIDRDGNVKTAFAALSTHRGFEKAAVEAVNKWKFKPAQKNDKAVNYQLRLPIRFQFKPGDKK